MLVKFNGKVKDVPVTEVTKENYIVPENEMHGYHVKVEFVAFDPQTGERKSRPSIMKFGKKAWHNCESDLIKRGATIEVLHDPNKKKEKAEK